jgi:hypothetical protein
MHLSLPWMLACRIFLHFNREAPELNKVEIHQTVP